jgi:catechol 2,3-dioxygenase-like lactoylglutathione lyase family enzyme
VCNRRGDFIGECIITVGERWRIVGSKQSVAPFPSSRDCVGANLDKESLWYQRVLGFKEVNRVANGSDFEMRELTVPGCRIDLVWRRGSTKRGSNGAGAEQGWLHVVFQTPDVKAAFKHLTELGTDVKADKNADDVIHHLTLHDPEGNEIGIASE